MWERMFLCIRSWRRSLEEEVKVQEQPSWEQAKGRLPECMRECTFSALCVVN